MNATLLATALTLTAAGCASAASQAPAPRLAALSCSELQDASQEVARLYAAGIANVEPIHRTEFIARAIQPRYLAGARFTVAAERGVTAPYLERTLTCHAMAQAESGHPNDVLRAQGVADVDVEAHGPAFRVSVTGTDRAAGDAIYQRARALEGGDTRVQVQQVASTTAPSRL